MSPSPSEIADVLDRAATHIDTVGWIQGDLYDSFTNPLKPLTQCRVCAIGALNMALHGTPQFQLPHDVKPDELTAHDVADAYLRSRIGGGELAEWNDTPGRAQGEVTALLRETAADLRGGAA
jgi:hypothetical protein